MDPVHFSLSSSERRVAAVAATVLVHAVLIVAWHAANHLPLPTGEAVPFFVGVLRPIREPLAPKLDKTTNEAPRAPVVDGATAWPRTSGQSQPERTARPSERVGEPVATMPPTPAAGGLDAVPPATAPIWPAPFDNARQILERAKRDAGAIDRALRKENNPYIVAPLDSPQTRMRRKIEEAAALAPNRLWEAPKMEDLVNDSGDGARRTRVITGGGIIASRRGRLQRAST